MRARSTRHNADPGASDPVLHEKHPLPKKPAELTWRDYLIMLLHIAAELEQALMVEYLYAAYSLGGDESRKHDAQVQEWRTAILGVAKEEMGHLLTVQNLLCLLGGPISFDREDYPWDTPYYPFEFCLEPLTLRSVAKYVFAEMPPDIHANDGRDGETAREALKLLGIAPGHPVGEVYDQIIDIISDPERIPDSDFNADSYGVQASFDDWGRNYRPGPLPPHAKSTDPQPRERETRLIIARMATRTEAIEALRDVAGQGEAPHLRGDEQTEPSHFDRFAKVFRELKKIQDEDPDWTPARHVPTNPVVLAADVTLPGATNITAKASRIWASLFNVRYRMLLTYLSHTYRMPRPAAGGDDDGVYAAVMVKIFGEMYNLKTLAGILVRLPLTDAKDPRRAGPTFQMPYTLTLPIPDVACWKQHRDLVSSSQALVAELLDAKGDLLADAPPDGRRYLTTLRDLDLQSIAFIDQILVGLRPSRRGRR